VSKDLLTPQIIGVLNVTPDSFSDGGRYATDDDAPTGDLLQLISAFLQRQADLAKEAGVRPHRIVVDPGLGKFISNDSEDSWKVLRNLERFSRLGYPLLLGASRKGFLGAVSESAAQRDPVSALVGVFAATHGISYIRTHNVSLTKQFLKTWFKLTA
jgi:dihydropteroate synthase